MISQTYTINGSTYEPLTDYLRGWIPGALGLPCPANPNAEVVRGHALGAKDRETVGLRLSCITNVLWHSCTLLNTCRKVA